MNEDKQRLFEVMGKVNPEFISEAAPPIGGTQAPAPVGQAATTPTGTAQLPAQKPLATDVVALNKATQTASGMQNKMTRINTATEFPQAFKSWFAGLGYKPENPAISTARVLTDIRKAMAEMGYK